MGLVDTLIAQFQVQQERANAANEQRFQQGLEMFDRIVQQNEAGGTLQTATEAAIDRGRTKSVAQGTQALVTAGLSGTTQAAGLGKKFEEEVGVPARLQAADISQQRLSQALRDKAGFIERREDVGPSFSDIAGLAQSIGAGRQSRTISGQVTGGSRSRSDVPGSFSSAAYKAGRAASQAAQDLRVSQNAAAAAARRTSSNTQRGGDPTALAKERRRYAAQQYSASASNRQSLSF